ncbi:Uncharacterized protein APZ42_016844 [Daphnia magna]|uniref:Uncharacterized protein n=1 Tax=Daphnia magna TaxID=35525 RepID=A0A165A7B4_9CRUS|nr:Uncharacterized protein APZ42_016844 [Daphnia magna]
MPSTACEVSTGNKIRKVICPCSIFRTCRKVTDVLTSVEMYCNKVIIYRSLDSARKTSNHQKSTEIDSF